MCNLNLITSRNSRLYQGLTRITTKKDATPCAQLQSCSRCVDSKILGSLGISLGPRRVTSTRSTARWWTWRRSAGASTRRLPFLSDRIVNYQIPDTTSNREVRTAAQHSHNRWRMSTTAPSCEQVENRVAVAQMTATADRAANFRTCEKLAQQAAAQGCSMLFLPECCSFIGESAAETVAQAQHLDGPEMQQFRDLARSSGLWLSLGGFQESGPDPEHIYNSHVIVNSSGSIAASYRKIHLFDVDVPNGPVLLESRSTAPGSQIVACDSPAGRLGVTVCFDLRFPELYQRLRFEEGADLMLVPSAFTKATGEAHWHILLRARAIETQSFVIAAAQAGKHNVKRESYGHSLIIDPWGRIIAQLDDPHATGIAIADLDFGELRRVRERMPIDEHRTRGRERYWNVE